jgi:HD-GYP domain-containing protein (c-di-GMP phosphodiesterase class II)
MRRVSVTNAKPGMTLGRAVYDIRGQMLLGEGDKIEADSIGLLARSGTAEILIQDPRVQDVPVGALFSAHMEAKAVQGLHMLLVNSQGVSEAIMPVELMGIRPTLVRMTERLIPTILGDPDLCGLSSSKVYDYVHPVKVAELSMLIGAVIGARQEQLVDLGLAAMLENIGYLALPEGMLEKPGSLTIDEWEHVHRHPKYGAEMLAKAELGEEALTAIEQHHERWSGSGYPEGHRGKATSLFARIIAIADTYHALLSRRPHRKALHPHEAVEFIVAYSGDMFDPELVKLFARRIPQYPAGLAVKLSTGEMGIVSDPNVGHIARPIIRICAEKGENLSEPYDLDLSRPDCMTKLISEVIL